MNVGHEPRGEQSALRPHGGWGALAVLAVGLALIGLAGVPRSLRPAGQALGNPASAPARSPLPGTPRGLPQGPVGRSLFVWDGALATSAPGREALLALAIERGIEQLFVDASAVGYGQPGALADHAALVAAAHDVGVLVVAAGGFPWWGVSDTAGLPGQPTGHAEGWAYYAAIADSGIPYDGVLDNTEPYLAAPDDWHARTPQRAQDYLDFLKGVRARTAPLRFFATIPFWYDEDPAYFLALDGQVGGQASAAALNTYVAALADAVVVMDYRDFARGADGLLAHVAGELATGPTVIAVETTWLGDDPVSDKLTFWQEGEARLEQELALVARSLRREPNLAGFALHDEVGYRLLGP